MSGGFFRGTSIDQDTRFSDKDVKLLKTHKFAPELDHLVVMSNVNMDVMRPWISNRVYELLGFEDEILTNLIVALHPNNDMDGKKIQGQLSGFLEHNTSKFTKGLWTLLLSAQENASGVPNQSLEEKEAELMFRDRVNKLYNLFQVPSSTQEINHATIVLNCWVDTILCA